jgi:hypothetical protein
MPSLVGAGIAEDFEARPCARIVAPTGEEARKRVPRLTQLRAAPPDRVGAHQRG